MFTRTVRAALKPGQGEAFTHLIENKVLPILHKQKGFRDEVLLISGDGKESIGVSIWERQEDAEAYDRAAYPEVKKLMEPFLTAPPTLHTYNVALSTVHAAVGKK